MKTPERKSPESAFGGKLQVAAQGHMQVWSDRKEPLQRPKAPILIVEERNMVLRR
jgi:hypothetical protein